MRKRLDGKTAVITAAAAGYSVTTSQEAIRALARALGEYRDLAGNLQSLPATTASLSRRYSQKKNGPG